MGGLALAGCSRGETTGGSRSASASPTPSHGVAQAHWNVARGEPRQAGIATPPGLNAHWLGIDLPKSATAADLRRVLVVLSDAADRLVSGSVPLTDAASEMAVPAGTLAIAMGLGPQVFELDGVKAQRPSWLAPLPSFSVDKFEKPWGQTDLVIQIDGNDAGAVSHAAATMRSNLVDVANVRWQQRGFHPKPRAGEKVMRNQFGQLDGQVNLTVSSASSTPGIDDRLLWNVASANSPWLAGTTGMVLRRIRMDVPLWDSVDREGRENAIGRRLADGSPLSGGGPDTPVNPSTLGRDGLTMVNPAAHAARALPRSAKERILRRPYSYDEIRSDGSSEQGLIFAAFCANITEQFLPIQQRLAEADLLNTWTSAIGSAVYLMPAAPRPGRYLGQDILEA